MKEVFLRITALQILVCSLALWGGEAKAAPATNILDADRDKEIEYRLNWNLKTLLDDYERHGRHDPKWDGPARVGLTNFAQSRASFGSAKATEAWAKIPTVIKAAVSNGCDDPMIRYLYARAVLSAATHTDKELAEAYRAAAEGLDQSQYAPVRKFYAALRTAQTLNLKSTNTPPEVHRWRGKALQYLAQALSDKAMPPAEVYEACQELLQAVKNNKKQLGEYYHTLEPILFNTWPSNSLPYLIKGTFYVDYAWQGRGAAYAFKVTDQAWELFAERLVEAEKALTKAWELNPRDERIACQMISVELGQGKGRPRMERWFERAADLNPNYYEAFHAKLYYLEPKWHGSPEEMLQFGQQCVNSKRWGGRVPLILLDAHDSLAKYLPKDEQAAYWKQPEVWQDIKEALEKFLTLNPEETRWRRNYALYAYRAEQWDDLNRQLPLLGEIDYEFFGGKVQYEKMVRLAKEHAKK